MVTQAAKDLLKNTIQSVGFHNRVLEEQEMWKQWELEQGLTMMVSDDHIRQRIAEREAAITSKESRGCKRKKVSHKGDRSSTSKSNAPQTKPTSTDRWDHSGFFELEYGKGLHEKRIEEARVSSDSNQSNSQSLTYGPKPPPRPREHSRSKRKNKNKDKRRSPSSSSSTLSSSSSSSDSSDGSENPDNSATSGTSSSSSSDDGGRCSKRRRYRKVQQERRGRSPTRRRTNDQVATYGQCLKLRQIKREAKRHGRGGTCSSNSESESRERNRKEESSSDESENTSSSSSEESTDYSSDRNRHSRRYRPSTAHRRPRTAKRK